MPQYSLLARETEWEITPAARDAGLGARTTSQLQANLRAADQRARTLPAGH
jgi:aryl-alcohol dehydrogenase-like predicted oxidoreductase